MEAGNINRGNIALSQARNISQNKSVQTNENFSQKEFVAQALALNNKEVVPKDLMADLIKRHGEDFFDGIEKNANNEITFENLDKHMKDNKPPRITTSTNISGDFNPANLRRPFGNEKVPQSKIDDIKKIHGENFLDDFKPKDSENITFRELGDFMKANIKDENHRPHTKSGFFTSDQKLSNDELKNMLENDIKTTNSNDNKRSEFMFPSSYSRVDIAKIFMDVSI